MRLEARGNALDDLINISRPREEPRIWTVETQGTHNAAIKEMSSEQSNKSASEELARGEKRRSDGKRTRREKMERAIQLSARL